MSNQLKQEHLQQIQAFINKQVTGSSVPIETEAEMKEVRKLFQNAQNLLAVFIQEANTPEKRTQLFQAFENLTEIAIKYEEQINQLKFNNSILKDDTERTSQENMRLTELKDKYNQVCKEIGDAVNQIKKTNKLMVEQEEIQRSQLVENFENSLKGILFKILSLLSFKPYKNKTDITSKIDEQDKEREEKEKENNQLKEQLKQLISEYEEKEKTYLTGLEEKDGQFKNKVEEFMNQIKSVETEAHQALQLRAELNQLAQSETEKKLKIAIYQKRTGDLEESIRRTNSTVTQLKETLLKMYWKQQKLQKQQEQLVSHSEKGESLLLTFIKKNQDIEDQIKEVKSKKEVLTQKIQAIQSKIKALAQLNA
ncbi:hypothetical protein ABPG72_004456 [Tetrahymena utriculariae]